MSRTYAHQPFWTLENKPEFTKEDHDHRNGECDLADAKHHKGHPKSHSIHRYNEHMKKCKKVTARVGIICYHTMEKKKVTVGWGNWINKYNEESISEKHVYYEVFDLDEKENYRLDRKGKKIAHYADEEEIRNFVKQEDGRSAGYFHHQSFQDAEKSMNHKHLYEHRFTYNFVDENRACECDDLEYYNPRTRSHNGQHCSLEINWNNPYVAKHFSKYHGCDCSYCKAPSKLEDKITRAKVRDNGIAIAKVVKKIDLSDPESLEELYDIDFF